MSLFEPLIIGRLTLPNRVTMAALTRQRAEEDGVPTDLHVEYYAQRASAGLVVTEGTFPAFTNRAFPGQAGIADQAQQDGWRRVADEVHDRGGRIFMQIMNGGRMSHQSLTRGVVPEAPSAIASGTRVHTFDGTFDAPVPRALGTDEIPRIVSEFVEGARRAVDAGLDGVEIHGANGYILHEFLAPTSNHRTDLYGGSPENRARLLTEVIRAVADEVGADRTAVRISPEHNVQGTVEDDEADVLATYGRLLDDIADLPLAYISLLHKEPQSAITRLIREKSPAPLVFNTGFGEVTQREDATAVVESGIADAVAVGRMLIANPDLAQRWEHGLSLNDPEPSTFYRGGAHGYTDYPAAERIAQA
ncbi:alkene reductase [Gordonia zhaorongruii]|uniref:alkene reductase n=1 Tax=Gordonia zhaorongruii TaxID=2597659 RepID=UPI001051E78B|nr:alkene reductase [Gordonia zhaorongruii]